MKKKKYKRIFKKYIKQSKKVNKEMQQNTEKKLKLLEPINENLVALQNATVARVA